MKRPSNQYESLKKLFQHSFGAFFKHEMRFACSGHSRKGFENGHSDCNHRARHMQAGAMDENVTTKKRAHEETEQLETECAPDAKKQKVVDVENEAPDGSGTDVDSHISIDDSISSSDEQEPVVERGISWWKSFYNTPSRFHATALAEPTLESFLDKVMPPVNEKWKNKVMYFMSHHGSRGRTEWAEAEYATIEEDAALKKYLSENPEYEVSLGELEGKHSDVRVSWSDLVDWETRDPRVMEEHNPMHAAMGYLETVMMRAMGTY
jgi:hypothetical protein